MGRQSSAGSFSRYSCSGMARPRPANTRSVAPVYHVPALKLRDQSATRKQGRKYGEHPARGPSQRTKGSGEL